MPIGLGFRHILPFLHMGSWRQVPKLPHICGEFSILCLHMVPHHILMLQCILTVEYMLIHPFLQDLILLVLLLCLLLMALLRLLDFMQGNTPGSMEMDGKPPEVKEKLPIKRSKGSLGSLNMITGKNNNLGKTSGASANGGYSKSADSGSEGTSEGSDANSQNDSQLQSGDGKDSGEGEASQNGRSAHGPQNGGPNSAHSVANTALAIVPISTTGAATAVPGPTTNLHIGMDYWGTPASSNVPAMHAKVPSTPVAGGIVTPGSRDNVQSQLWLQDERELKRQRRKQSNRESARRSRLRKQAECDELAQRAEALKEENANLRSEVSRLKSEYEQLHAENASLKERLGEIPGHEDLKSGRNDQHRNEDEETESVQGSH
ncbi:hypothetical protein V6Z12_A08G175800 [Gossypium hirsutum]